MGTAIKLLIEAPLSPVQRVSYALAVASGSVPAYSHPLERLHYIEQGIEIMQGAKSKKFQDLLGGRYDPVLKLLQKYKQRVTAMENARQDLAAAEAKVAELETENQALSRALWEL